MRLYIAPPINWRSSTAPTPSTSASAILTRDTNYRSHFCEGQGGDGDNAQTTPRNSTPHIQFAGTHTQFYDHLDKLLECPVCYDVILPPIISCCSGHSCCGTCRASVENCPVCRGEFSNVRNLFLEQLLEKCQFKCKHACYHLNKLLECPVCYEVILPPIISCCSGHSCCETCRASVENCPVCRGELSNVRNLLVEQLLEKCQFKCKYGCNVYLAAKDLANHYLAECAYRPIHCRECDRMIPFNDFLQHVHKLRRRNTSECSTGFEIDEEDLAAPDPVSLLTVGREHPPRQGNNGGKHEEFHDHHPFVFSVLQFEKARWHPLINLVNGEKHFSSKGPPGIYRRRKVTNSLGGANGPRNGPGSQSEAKNEADLKLSKDYILTWFQMILAMVTTGFLALGLVLAVIYARRKARKRDFSSAKHCRKLSRRHRVPGTGSSSKLILTSEDLSFGTGPSSESNKKGGKPPFIGSFQRLGSQEKEKPDLLKGSFSISATINRGSKGAGVTNNNANNGELNNGSATGALEHIARHKGDIVYLKKLPLSDAFEVRVKTMLVLETVHSLRHENLVTLVGCFLGSVGSPCSPSGPALVWEYCSRGSLYDIIKQSDIKLDWAFKLSLLTDLVRGMRYLHSSMVRVHGSLTSHNCVIDARWVLKITDYGLPAFYYTQGLPLPKPSARELLWTAPELLRDEGLCNQGTPAGDVYSFAIIMQEVLVRGEPYCMLTLTAEEILVKVKRPPPLIRPSVSKSVAPPEAINIMRQCWAELPDMRPDFLVIHDLFKTLNHGRKANIVDTMFQMLEKYSNNLEELIRERTEQLDLEKKKTEQLLNRMLPNTVAEKLKVGLPVDPEEFSEVTIYFSDIVGFTTISAHSTPFEVVDLLNDLYTCFDATINDYNVYKMVVGGAPLWSPDHADQIATMALELLYQSGRFKIRHLPYTHLRLRIGLHTGPCCTGVVGLTMPRYCLFGDTVNTASRMESTGAPWRIHISSETKAKLDEAGGYIIEPRGMTDIKGKGPMPTYWLLGKEGIDKELPTPPGVNECHRLDEKAIKYGRTGVWPDDSGSETRAASQGHISVIKLMEREKSNFKTSPHHLAPPKSPSSFAVVQGPTGETLRSLSPAEQIAHQLLNGRPTTKGLRRQLSLDHRAMPRLLKQAQSANAKGPSLLRRAPSLEENLEAIPSTNTNPKSLNKPAPPTICISNTSPIQSKNGTPRRESSAISTTITSLLPPSSREPSPTPTIYSSSLPAAPTNYFCTSETPPPIITSSSPRQTPPFYSAATATCPILGTRISSSPTKLLQSSNVDDSVNINVDFDTDKVVQFHDEKIITSLHSKINNYVIVDATTLLSSETGVRVKDLNSGESCKVGFGRLSSSNMMTTTTTTMSSSRAAKLTKILSVVEEGNDSPTLERKYDIVTNQV